MEMCEEMVVQSDHSGEVLYNILPNALSKRGGMEPDDLLCSRNARPKKDGKGSLAVLLLAERAR
jgi:hypothetical protein